MSEVLKRNIWALTDYDLKKRTGKRSTKFTSESSKDRKLNNYTVKNKQDKFRELSV